MSIEALADSEILNSPCARISIIRDYGDHVGRRHRTWPELPLSEVAVLRLICMGGIRDGHVLLWDAKTGATTSWLSGQVHHNNEPLSANFPGIKVKAGDTVSFAVGFGVDGNYFGGGTALAAQIASAK